MNRKQRKERLKRLNAQRKETLKNPLSDGFRVKIVQFTTPELEVVLDHLYATYTFDETPKVKARIEFVGKVIQARRDTRRWVKTPEKVHIDPDSSKYRLC